MFPEAGDDVEVVQGEFGKFAGEDFDLGAHVQLAVQDDAALPSEGAEAAGPAFQVCAGDADAQPFGKGFEFLEKLGVSHGSGQDCGVREKRSIIKATVCGVDLQAYILAGVRHAEGANLVFARL